MKCRQIVLLILTDLYMISYSHADLQMTSSLFPDLATGPRPIFQLHYWIFYNTSLDNTSAPVGQKVSNTCADFTARTFLINLLSIEEWINRQCVEEISSDLHNISSHIRVIVHPVVTVTVYGSRVKVETELNITTYEDVEERGREAIEMCASRINNTILRNVKQLDEVLSNSTSTTDKKLLTRINGTRICQTAEMEPKGFIYRLSRWECPGNLVVNHALWRCVVGGAESRLTSSPTILPTVAKRMMTEATYSNVTDTSISVTSESPASVTLSPAPKLWGVEVQKDVNRIYVSEGDRPYDLGLHVWFDQSAVCDNSSNCTVSLRFSFADKHLQPEPICRKTKLSIPQLVIGHPSWSSSAGFCSLTLHMDNVNNDKELNISIATGNVFIKAVVDHKYDGTQVRDLIVSIVKRRLENKTEEILEESMLQIPVVVEDRDRKSTCQSINDPHMSTFDGLEYNNFYEGEFILYRHKTLPFSVHVVYQQCGQDAMASCNCAVAVQSGDDVLVIDRCLRRRHRLPPPIGGFSDDHVPVMSVRLYLNGNLTAGTQINQDAEGRKYIVYLPHGAYIKVTISGQLINVWVVPSSNDLYMTEGLCGFYDGNKNNDLHWRNGTTIVDGLDESGSRIQPADFIRDWRVELDGKESLLRGVEPTSLPYQSLTYCECEQHSVGSHCGAALDVNFCDLMQGKDITASLISRAHKASTKHRHKKRGIDDNSVVTPFEDVSTINIDKKAVPPSKYKWKDEWNEVSAKKFCRDYIKDKYSIGQLCSRISSVNFDQEITTCVEDIKITGNMSWADSARDAMKEQCREAAQKNSSLPRHIADRVTNELCINDCSQHGSCADGSCHCDAGYVSADCSIHENMAPDTSAAWRYGLCDIRTMNCSHVIVYGDNFINSPNLTCHLQEAKVTSATYIALDVIVTRKAEFISFNAVECSVPLIRSYLISISNNGINQSKALLFIPFDSACSTCNIFNTSCVKIRNSCIIDGICYREGEASPSDQCLICKAFDDEYEWTTVAAEHCHPPWWDSVHLPDSVVVVAAAITGSLVGVIIGFLLYKCCCRRKKVESHDEDDDGSDVYDAVRHATPVPSAFDDSLLHRDHSSTFQSQFASLSDLLDADQHSVTSPSTNRQQLVCSDALGVENGLDSTTYF